MATKPWNQNAPRKITTTVGGEKREIVVPRTPADVDLQDDVPAWGLALLALSPYDERGIIRWSPFARETLKRLAEQYGDFEVRKQLRGLLIDIEGGFVPDNPIGLLIHRVRVSGTTRPIEL